TVTARRFGVTSPSSARWTERSRQPRSGTSSRPGGDNMDSVLAIVDYSPGRGRRGSRRFVDVLADDLTEVHSLSEAPLASRHVSHGLSRSGRAVDEALSIRMG